MGKMFRYIDLFCGIGGFHQGIDRVAKKNKFECECVFAADNDLKAAEVYKLNYNIDAFYDLKSDETHELIDAAIGNEPLNCIFAGFPCQPFSKAGNQEGFKNQIKGTLFFEIEKIIQRHHPEYILLENVRNLKNHDNGNTFSVIKSTLESEGYLIDDIIISPNHISAIPALRERIFILAYNKEKLANLDINTYKINKDMKMHKTSLYTNKDIKKGLRKTYFKTDVKSDLEEDKIKTIDMWNDLFHMLKDNGGYIISPLWPHFFDETSTKGKDIPEWKMKIIKKNQKFYLDNKEIYDRWKRKYEDYYNSLSMSDSKFEWNAGEDIDDIWQGIIQFRPSGVRVKRPDFIPTLVAINQTPILGYEKRYLQPGEMAKLYGFKRLKFGKELKNEKYKQLGNTVSVDVVEFLINHMLKVTNYGG